MLGRTSGGSGFRYLHDEISGGGTAFSKLQCQAAYTGNSVEIPSGGTGYGFIDGIVDLSQINIDQVGDNSVRYINQLNVGNWADTGLSGYNKASNDFIYESANEIGTHGGSISYADDPFTYVFVGNKNGNSIGSFGAMLEFGNTAGSSLIGLIQEGAKYSFYIYAGGVNYLWGRTVDTFANELVLIIWTYDGSQTLAGNNLYVNDVVTPKGIFSVRDTLSSAFGAVGRTNFGGRGASANFNGQSFEGHVFDKALSESERETAKEILEQYYTFT